MSISKNNTTSNSMRVGKSTKISIRIRTGLASSSNSIAGINIRMSVGTGEHRVSRILNVAGSRMRISIGTCTSVGIVVLTLVVAWVLARK